MTVLVERILKLTVEAGCDGFVIKLVLRVLVVSLVSVDELDNKVNLGMSEVVVEIEVVCSEDVVSSDMVGGLDVVISRLDVDVVLADDVVCVEEVLVMIEGVEVVELVEEMVEELVDVVEPAGRSAIVARLDSIPRGPSTGGGLARSGDSGVAETCGSCRRTIPRAI